MKNLTGITDFELLNSTKALVSLEREVTLDVLHHLQEVERRHLFAKLGFPSLFEYAVKELGYSEGESMRRITAMKLAKSLPEVKEKIKSVDKNGEIRRMIN